MAFDAGLEIDAGADAGVTEAADAGVDAGVTEVADAGPTVIDLDGDGLSDAWELQIATAYLPYLSLDPADGCSRGGVIFRLSPHPRNPALVYILYDHLYDTDCGLGGHPGDNEAFGVTVDPLRLPPSGITAIVAISHQGTACQRITKCGVCNGLTACETGGPSAIPVVYASKDKHGSYVAKDTAFASCNSGSCLDSCVLASSPTQVPLVNVGEPGHSLVSNLTTEGFITTANGWANQELFNFDPWDPTHDFGGAGLISGDLVDTSFVPEPCYAR